MPEKNLGAKKSQVKPSPKKTKGLRRAAPALGARRLGAAAKSSGSEPIICLGCGAVLYDKHWHSPELVAAWVDLKGAARGRCEACRAGARFAGELVIDGLKDSLLRDQVIALVRNVGKRASRRDPQARIIGITKMGPRRLRVLTSENQLAVAIGKQLHAAHKGGELTVTWSAEDKPVRVTWRWLK